MIKNPILPGFYPDPSICRVGDDYYLVTSSFSYYPGIPIFHSRDLAQWKQIGYVLDRPEQLPLSYEVISSGIFAPTIRYFEGVFYVISTNMSMGGKNFIVTSRDPAGPWSDLHIIEEADGIDPSLFQDQTGQVYYTGTTRFVDDGVNRQAIWCSKIDLKNFQLQGERHIIGFGAQIEAVSPEGPHLYQKDGWYYLLIAEGGTEHFHAVTVSRSRQIFGPYENYQGNPILTHRHFGKKYPICNVGHGDLVDTPTGNWYMVCLGSRLSDGYHKLLGRESFIVSVNWENGWPLVSAGRVEMNIAGDDEDGNLQDEMTSSPLVVYEDFNGDKLDVEWNFLGTPYEKFWRLEDSYLKLQLLKNQMVPWQFNDTDAGIFARIARAGRTKDCLSFVGRRQQHLHFTAETQILFKPQEKESAGLVLLQNDANQLRLEIIAEGTQYSVRCVRVSSVIDEHSIQHFTEQIVGNCSLPLSPQGYVLKITGRGIWFDFYAGLDKENLSLVSGDTDGSLLGSESAGGFVGTYIGLFASGGGFEKDKYADFSYFLYQEE